MKVLGNFLWFIFTGLWTGLGFFLSGIIWCITIIGIPFGLQFFKFCSLAFLPFGKTVEVRETHPIANALWFIFGGFAMTLGYFLGGIIWCVTIIGIPFGKQCFKLAKLSLTPFGREIMLPVQK